MFFRFVDLFLMKFNCVSYHNWIISRVRAEKKKEYAEAGPIERAGRECSPWWRLFFGTRNNTTSKKTNSPSKIFWLANGFLNRQLDFRSKNLSIWWFEGNFSLFRPGKGSTDTFFLGPSELWITLARFVRSVLYEKNFSVRNLFSFHFVRTGIGTWIPVYFFEFEPIIGYQNF